MASLMMNRCECEGVLLLRIRYRILELDGQPDPASENVLQHHRAILLKEVLWAVGILEPLFSIQPMEVKGTTRNQAPCLQLDPE